MAYNIFSVLWFLHHNKDWAAIFHLQLLLFNKVLDDGAIFQFLVQDVQIFINVSWCIIEEAVALSHFSSQRSGAVVIANSQVGLEALHLLILDISSISESFLTNCSWCKSLEMFRRSFGVDVVLPHGRQCVFQGMVHAESSSGLKHAEQVLHHHPEVGIIVLIGIKMMGDLVHHDEINLSFVLLDLT